MVQFQADQKGLFTFYKQQAQQEQNLKLRTRIQQKLKVLSSKDQIQFNRHSYEIKKQLKPKLQMKFSSEIRQKEKKQQNLVFDNFQSPKQASIKKEKVNRKQVQKFYEQQPIFLSKSKLWLKNKHFIRYHSKKQQITRTKDIYNTSRYILQLDELNNSKSLKKTQSGLSSIPQINYSNIKSPIKKKQMLPNISPKFKTQIFPNRLDQLKFQSFDSDSFNRLILPIFSSEKLNIGKDIITSIEKERKYKKYKRQRDLINAVIKKNTKKKPLLA